MRLEHRVGVRRDKDGQLLHLLLHSDLLLLLKRMNGLGCGRIYRLHVDFALGVHWCEGWDCGI